MPSGFAGEIVFEFTVAKGHVKWVMLDEKASNLQDSGVVEAIKRSLTIWQAPQSVAGTVRLTYASTHSN